MQLKRIGVIGCALAAFFLAGCTTYTMGVPAGPGKAYVIKNDVGAAPGLFLEFGNRVKPTRIREVRVFRHQDHGTCH